MSGHTKHHTIWTVSPGKGKRNTLSYVILENNTLELRLRVEKPGMRAWQESVVLEASPAQLRAGIKGVNAPWATLMQSEKKGRYRAVRILSIPSTRFCIVWHVDHLDVRGDGKQYVVRDKIRVYAHTVSVRGNLRLS